MSSPNASSSRSSTSSSPPPPPPPQSKKDNDDSNNTNSTNPHGQSHHSRSNSCTSIDAATTNAPTTVSSAISDAPGLGGRMRRLPSTHVRPRPEVLTDFSSPNLPSLEQEMQTTSPSFESRNDHENNNNNNIDSSSMIQSNADDEASPGEATATPSTAASPLNEDDGDD